MKDTQTEVRRHPSSILATSMAARINARIATIQFWNVQPRSVKCCTSQSFTLVYFAYYLMSAGPRQPCVWESTIIGDGGSWRGIREKAALGRNVAGEIHIGGNRCLFGEVDRLAQVLHRLPWPLSPAARPLLG